LAKRVKLNGKWMSRPADEVKNVTGIYVVTFWQHGRMIRKPIGTDYRKAVTALNTQNLILNAKQAGLVAEEPDDKRHLLKTVTQEYLAHPAKARSRHLAASREGQAHRPDLRADVRAAWDDGSQAFRPPIWAAGFQPASTP
jgi:hypothetical protein